MGSRSAASILPSSSVKRLMVAGEPGGGEPTMRAKLEAAWGASVTEAMGIGDISVSLWGECEAKAGMHFSGRGFVHFELIDPASGAAVDDARRRRGRARADAPRQPLRAVAALSHPRSRAARRRALRLRAHRAARALHRAHRRHADRARRQRVSLRGARSGQRIRPRGDRRRHDPAARRGRAPGAAPAGERRGRRTGAARASPNAFARAFATRFW